MSQPLERPLTSFWQTAPHKLKQLLCLGYTGKQHLIDIIEWGLEEQKTFAPLTCDALQTVFAENPLDGEMATQLLSHKEVRDLLPKKTRDTLQKLVQQSDRPRHLTDFEHLLEQRDLNKLKSYIADKTKQEPKAIFWREKALAFGLISNDPEWVSSTLFPSYPEELTPCFAAAQAHINSFIQKETESAISFETKTTPFGSALLPLLATGTQDEETTTTTLLRRLKHAPWDTSSLLRAHDLLTQRTTDLRQLDGTVAILLYSWNKGVELNTTLRSLFNSDLTGASIFVLDNGSTDDTHTIIKKWQERFCHTGGPDHFHSISLPINIGAPAARNWLMHHPLVGRHDFICYLDDDVEVTQDWLLRLGSAVYHYPLAGVWGAKVVNHTNSALLQSADSHLLVPTETPQLDLTKPTPNPFKLSTLHVQSLNSGQFDFMRPCASVTGCCHLFRTRTLFDSGDFSIHLSPTQYDDMEHDLRLCISGQFPVYQGHLTIPHKKCTGAASHFSDQQQGSALGNKYKMQTMHDHAELATAMRQEFKLLEEDLLSKIEVVEEAMRE